MAAAAPTGPAPWRAAPPSPLHTHPESVRLWLAHVEAALPWLRAHDAGVRALAPLAEVEPGCFAPAAGGAAATAGSLAGVGLLVEPRAHAHLEFVLRNWAHFVAGRHPGAWGLIVAHGTENGAHVREVTAGWPHVRLVDLGVPDLPLPAYQALLTDAGFWRRFAGLPRVMLLQVDTAQLGGGDLGPGSPLLTEYDYVGAPWANTCAVCGEAIVRPPPAPADAAAAAAAPAAAGCGHMVDHAALAALAPDLVGNGGLSLRNPAAMVEACEAFALGSAAPLAAGDPRVPLAGTSNEDVFFATALVKLGRRVAPRAVAAEFAIEQVPPLRLDPAAPAAVGIHKAWAYLPPAVMKVVLDGVRYVDGT